MVLKNYHCHVYFTANQADQAQVLLGGIEAEFGLERGRFHTAPIGPHIGGSCQVLFQRDDLGPLVAWLMANRNGLTCFIHGVTGDDLVDHTDHVLWVGPEWELDLARFRKD
ncbi:MAG: DOPA 4,5-dioxygenase family protein [Planctomycetota bacterium]|jgi:aromatic ring-cleaving dioxygenase|nr:DOPA 4,5-dioxygenase family protein [Planctomycetota bacterium]MDG2144537.1 DOPA 4,5-dioxygenase family protein [Planctomycetota bacterium]